MIDKTAKARFIVSWSVILSLIIFNLFMLCRIILSGLTGYANNPSNESSNESSNPISALSIATQQNVVK